MYATSLHYQGSDYSDSIYSKLKGVSTVETLGYVNVLCSGKTGTFTENRVVVTSFGFVDRRMSAEDAYSVLSEEASAP